MRPEDITQERSHMPRCLLCILCRTQSRPCTVCLAHYATHVYCHARGQPLECKHGSSARLPCPSGSRACKGNPCLVREVGVVLRCGGGNGLGPCSADGPAHHVACAIAGLKFRQLQCNGLSALLQTCHIADTARNVSCGTSEQRKQSRQGQKYSRCKLGIYK